MLWKTQKDAATGGVTVSLMTPSKKVAIRLYFQCLNAIPAAFWRGVTFCGLRKKKEVWQVYYLQDIAAIWQYERLGGA